MHMQVVILYKTQRFTPVKSNDSSCLHSRPNIFPLSGISRVSCDLTILLLEKVRRSKGAEGYTRAGFCHSVVDILLEQLASTLFHILRFIKR